MHHYNFPSYSVEKLDRQEDRKKGNWTWCVSRKSACSWFLQTEQEFPYAIRTVSEVLESNGSTVQAFAHLLFH